MPQPIFGKKKRGKMYRLSDEYSYFYLGWIHPIKEDLKSDPDGEYWHSQLKTPKHHAWQGYAFENVCYKHLSKIKKKLGIRGFAPASSWRSAPSKGSREEGAQIDLLFDRGDDAITLCEIKYADKPCTLDKRCAKSLANKQRCFVRNTQTKKQIFMAFISPHGVADSLYAEELNGGVVILDDFY
jgi:hypothetical protein